MTAVAKKDVDDNLQCNVDYCKISDADVIMNCLDSFSSNTSNGSNSNHHHVSLIRLESGRKIWWLENAISSRRAEVMLRRRMKYLQHEQLEQQQHQEQQLQQSQLAAEQQKLTGIHDNNLIHGINNNGDVMTDEPYDNINGTQQHQYQEQVNNISLSDNDNAALSKQQQQQQQQSLVTQSALTKMGDKTATYGNATNNNIVNEVSLESIDEHTLSLRPITQQQQLSISASAQQMLQYCHQNDIPVLTIGSDLSSDSSSVSSTKRVKKTWVDFGDDNVNTVGVVSTRQFLIYASATGPATTTQAAAAATVSHDYDSSLLSMTSSENTNQFDSYSFDNKLSSNSVHNIRMERISSKQGFICVLNDHSPLDNNGNSSYNDLDPIQLQLKGGECQMVYVVWNPIEEGCVRESIELQVVTDEKEHEHQQKGVTRHELVLVGNSSAVPQRNATNSCIDFDSSSSCYLPTDKTTWNGVSIEYSEIREEEELEEGEGSVHPDLVVEGVGLITTEESIGSEDDDDLGWKKNVEEEPAQCDEEKSTQHELATTAEVHEIARMMQHASISPMKASMAAKRLSGQVSRDAPITNSNGVKEAETKQNKTNGSETKSRKMNSEDYFADGNRLISQTTHEVLYMNDKVRHLLDDFDAETTSSDDIDGQSGCSTPTFGSLSSREEGDSDLLGDLSQHHFNKRVDEQVDGYDKEITVQSVDIDVSLVAEQPNTHRFGITPSEHYDKVTAELNALMEDVSEEIRSQSDDDSGGSYVSSEECHQTQDEKFGFFNFNESMSDEENEEQNVLPTCSINSSADWDSSATDESMEAEQLRRNPYRQMSSELDGLIDEVSVLEEFAQMQQEYLISPTTHDFQTQLETLNEQIDNLTPSSVNSRIPTTSVMRNTSQKYPTSRLKEQGVVNMAKREATISTPKDSAQRCYFYKQPSRSQTEEKSLPIKSPFAAVLANQASLHSFDSTSTSSSSPSSSTTSICSSQSECEISNSSGVETESDLSNESSSDSSDSLTSCRASHSIPSQEKKTMVKSSQETRTKHIASMRSKLSSLKGNSGNPASSTQNGQLKTPTNQLRTPANRLKTPVLKQLDVASLQAASAQKAARMTYYFSQSSSETSTYEKQTPNIVTERLTTPSSKSVRTPLNTTSYEKHVNRIRRARMAYSLESTKL